MTALRIIRLLAWVAVIALGAAALLAVYGFRPGSNPTASLPFAASIGGPFALTSHENKRVTDKDLRGAPFALFFGFTNCPDVCPTTLLELTNRKEELGAVAERLRLVFISVDPERDTPDFMARYVANFDKGTIGLTGSTAEIAAVAKAYRAIYTKVPTKDGYTMDHTATVYLMDAQGRFAGTIAFGEAAEIQRQKLKRLLGAS